MIRRKIREGLARAFSMHGRVKIVHEMAASGEAGSSPLNRLPPIVADWLRNRLSLALRRALITFLRQRPQEFVAATDQPLDGVTLVATVEGFPGLAVLGKGIRGDGVDVRGLQSLKDVPNATIHVIAGHRRD